MNQRNLRDEKFIFFDIDGTFFDFKTGIPDSVREAFKLLHKNGHKVLIATGRTKAMIFEEILELGFDGIVGGGGSYVEFEGKEIVNSLLDKEEAIRVINIFKKNEMELLAEGPDALYYDDYLGPNQSHIIRDTFSKFMPDKIKKLDYENLRLSKISGGLSPKSNVEEIIKELGEDYEYAIHMRVLFESYHKDFTKARGINILAEAIGINMDNTYAFGDSFNDYDMLKTVKYGIVMGDGDPKLKELIPIHTDGFFENGVYNGLKRFELI